MSHIAFADMHRLCDVCRYVAARAQVRSMGAWVYAVWAKARKNEFAMGLPHAFAGRGATCSAQGHRCAFGCCVGTQLHGAVEQGVQYTAVHASDPEQALSCRSGWRAVSRAACSPVRALELPCAWHASAGTAWAGVLLHTPEWAHRRGICMHACMPVALNT